MASRWLLETEPGEYSFGDLVRDRQTAWDGVMNAADPRFRRFDLVRLPRLSVMPVPEPLWRAILLKTKAVDLFDATVAEPPLRDRVEQIQAIGLSHVPEDSWPTRRLSACRAAASTTRGRRGGEEAAMKPEVARILREADVDPLEAG